MPQYKKKRTNKDVHASSSDKKRIVRRGGGAANDSDDESVDSRGNIRGLIAYSDESESEDFTSESEPESGGDNATTAPTSGNQRTRPPRRAAAKAALELIREKYLQDIDSSNDSPIHSKKNRVIVPKKKRPIVSEEETTEDEDEDEDDAMDVESDEEGEDEDEDDEDAAPSTKKQGRQPQGISISFGPIGGDEGIDERMVPKRYNLKKEPAMVKQFVEFITKPPEESTIDDQIDRFKALPDAQQKHMLEGLERCYKTDTDKKGENMMFKILGMKASPAIQTMILSKYNTLQMLDPTSSEYYKSRNWVEKAIALPLGEYKDMPVRLEDGQEKCGAFMERAKACLDASIYGQAEAKLQILQFIASKVTNPNSRGLSLLLVGHAGVGKTTLIKNGIAKALDWPFQFISLGGDSDASTYTGHQLVYEGSHAGKIANSLITAKNLSMVLMFDEVDKISQTPKGEEVQHLLVHLTDPVQNADFEDKYLSGIPIDLSKVMFVFSANDITKLDPILLDRFVVIELEGYKLQEKLAIAEKFLWPDALREVNLEERVAISKDILEYIIETYCKDEPGVRELRRCCIKIAQKINMLRMYNTKDLPFHIPDFHLPFVLKKDHIKLFLTKREQKDKPPQGMYM